MAPRKKTAAAKKNVRRTKGQLSTKWKQGFGRAHSAVDDIHRMLRASWREAGMAKEELDLKISDLKDLKDKLKELKRLCFKPFGKPGPGR
jgi:hypothetical protein